MSVNERIKELRKELHLSQAKFAKAISISNGYIASIELGNRSVNERIIKLICTTFKVNETWLKTGEGPMFNDTIDNSTQVAMEIFKELKPEFQEYIIKQINQLLELQSKDLE
ncbi:TPA: helix-turn-helix transcriptional regulator [Clostridium perfringens]|uniref:XRE family transcriptional regulator n=1 Tax=Clostridium perfringens TaxID=1502 RepID=A0AB37CAI8_CLOPF|nr:helix-turn-helix transcriptional regulator [Clostridium perfringens]PWX42091.1 XRE family transcriptional regulator [Clostridium perfringens]PZT49583.1 XRE family transcriptional regulator [Clostridium perfringens]HAT4336737.1 helix-turn-helix transcriptional regulator [Clostridium perfringens]